MNKIATTKFWTRAMKCSHKNFTSYYYRFHCGTPFCSGIESHCKDCGAFIASCLCGEGSGVSGWSYRRWRKREQNRTS